VIDWCLHCEVHVVTCMCACKGTNVPRYWQVMFGNVHKTAVSIQDNTYICGYIYLVNSQSLLNKTWWSLSMTLVTIEIVFTADNTVVFLKRLQKMHSDVATYTDVCKY